jgi:DUF1680 family protein
LGKGLTQVHEPTLDYPIQPIWLQSVSSVGGFWGQRLETHRSALLPHAWKHLHHNIENFRKAAGKIEGTHEGLHWDDSDLYKVMEGAAYALALQSGEETQAFLDALIETVAAAQEPDGYLYTARTIDPENPTPGAGPTRWSFLPGSHELYCMGHVIEAALAHYEASGRRTFLNVALLTANLLDATFGEGKLRDVPGHQEVELALAKLYRVTGDPRFLRLCRFFVEERGRHDRRKSYGEAEQDHLPALEQTVPVGHAVRAAYLYSAMTDIAALQDDAAYALASEHLWNEVVTKRMALTGAVGARHDGEAFGDPYELPNREPHNETCASVGMMLWSHRLFLLNGDSKYLDALERTLYNAYLASHSLDGKAFFYCNPLEASASDGDPPKRSEWIGCACCPTNVARITPQVPALAYAIQDNRVYASLFMEMKASLELQGGRVRVKTATNYPWSGNVSWNLQSESDAPFYMEFAVRIPGWAVGHPVPGDLYQYQETEVEPFSLTLNGIPARYQMERGFAVMGWAARPGEATEVRLDLPMPIRRVLPHERIEATQGKIAIERGPLVYCVEGVDHPQGIGNLQLSEAGELKDRFDAERLGGIVIITDTEESRKGSPSLLAIPYFAWDNREPSEMTVWLKKS